MADRGGEVGTTTGRPRRCGWIDLVALRYAVRLNTMNSLVVTKLDVLSGLDPIKVCTRYRHPEGAVFDEFPYHQSIIHTAEPEYEELPGFEGDIGDARRESDLPKEARDYLTAISDHAGAPIRLVGVGPGRDQVVWMGEESPDAESGSLGDSGVPKNSDVAPVRQGARRPLSRHRRRGGSHLGGGLDGRAADHDRAARAARSASRR